MYLLWEMPRICCWVGFFVVAAVVVVMRVLENDCAEDPGGSVPSTHVVGGSEPFITPIPGDLTLSDLSGYQARMWHTDKHFYTHKIKSKQQQQKKTQKCIHFVLTFTV